jgi:aminoglycoside/choline kinase family phosphotransferase
VAKTPPIEVDAAHGPSPLGMPPERFLRDAGLTGIQRHLKVLGIFARLHHRDGKPKYIADAPRFLAYLDEALPRHPELAPLAGVIERHVRPALAALTAA